MPKVSNIRNMQTLTVQDVPSQQDGAHHATRKRNSKSISVAADDMFGERTSEIYTITKSDDENNVSLLK